MSPARNKSRRARVRLRKKISKKPSKRFNKKRIIIFLLTLLVIGACLYQKSSWYHYSNFVLVTRGSEKIVVTAFDRVNHEITSVSIPNSTEVEVARALGTWQLGSVWELGLNEGFAGQLLAETVTFNFNLPTTFWAEEEAEGFFNSSLSPRLSATFSPYKTNLAFLDRINIALFSLGVNNLEREELDLSKNGVLKKKTLRDGNAGFVMRTKVPTGIISIFSDPDLVKSQARVLIKDSTGKPYLSDVVGEVLESLGGKITLVKKVDPVDGGCVIGGKDELIVMRIAKLLSCKEETIETESNFDIEVLMGEGFAERF